MSELRTLPRELWQHIFGYLAVRDLRTAIQVCHDWCNLIVGTRALNNRLKISITRETTLDHRTSGFRFVLARHVFLTKTTIRSAEPWWPTLGANLTDLALYECTVPVPTLLTMLRQAPNLARLALDNVLYQEMENCVEADFQLNQLEHLRLLLTFAPQIVDILRPACPALKSFTFAMANPEKPCERQVIAMVQTVQGTLVQLDVPINGAVGNALLSMDRLKLRSLSMNYAEAKVTLNLCRMQPDLQILDTSVVLLSNAHLRKIGELLPNLRQLTTNFTGLRGQEPEFLAAMPNLEELTVAAPCIGRFQRIPSLGDHRCLKLKSLNLVSVVLDSRHDAWTLLHRSPNIETLTVRGCPFRSWSKFVAGLNELRSLKLLALNAIAVANWTDPAVWVANDGVQILRLWRLKIPKIQLMQLLSAFPNLKELHLGRTPVVDDAVVLELPRLFPRLRRLLIFECSNSEATVAHVAGNCPLLQVLKLEMRPLTHSIKHLSAQEYALTGSWLDWCGYIITKLRCLFW